MTRILIVDDNLQNRYLLESILTGYGFEVASATNGAEALETARHHPPDMMVTDILMPVMDGFELCRRWKADERLSAVPLIFYTATYTDPKDEQFALGLGADRFVVKPQKPEVIGRIVRELLEEYRKKGSAGSSTTPGDEMDVLRQYNEVLFRKLERKVSQYEAEIAERRRVQEELVFKNIILSTQEEASPDGILVVDDHGTILIYNRKFIEIWGIPDHLVTRRTGEPVPDEPVLRHVTEQLIDPEAFLSRVRYLYNHKDEKSFEELLLRDGRVLERFSSPMFGEEGKYYGRVWFFRDITTRKRAEEKIRESEATFRTVVENVPDFIFVHRGGTILYINRSMARTTGYDTSEVIGQPITRFIAPEFEEKAASATSRKMAGEAVEPYEADILTKSGTRVTVIVRGSRIDYEGAPAILNVLTDITERKRAEEALRDYAKRLQEVQEMAHLGFWSWDVKTGQVEWSDEVFRIFGCDPEKFVPKIDSIMALSPWPEDHDRDRELIRRAIESREPGSFEQRFLRPDNSTGYYYSTFQGRYDENGDLVSIIGTVLDITDRKTFEENLRESEARYRTLYESMRDANIKVDMAGQIVQYNQPFIEMLGFSDRELVRLTYDALTPERWHAFESYIIETQVMIRGYSDVYEKEFRKKDGTVFPVELRMYLLRDTDEQPVGMGAIVRDITERKRAEEKIRLANSKLALMTEVTYQDIQNKITGLRGFVELSKNAESREECQSFIRSEEEILESVHDLIKKTKDYQQMGVDKSGWIPIERTIRMQLALVSLRREISLRCDLHGLEIFADPLLEKVFYNLIHNAIRHGRTITTISFGCIKTPGGIMLICEDDGVGIPPEEKPHLFERVVGGSGRFGLFFVREFLALSGIIIRETGAPGTGARFEMAVPEELCRFLPDGG
jgi:PAS domain S-box-containing protein